MPSYISNLSSALCSISTSSRLSITRPKYYYEQTQNLWLLHLPCNTVCYIIILSPYLAIITHRFGITVRLGKSGLKVSRIILGCMSYGTPEWQPWVLDEKAGLEHIKAAYEAGINVRDPVFTYHH